MRRQQSPFERVRASGYDPTVPDAQRLVITFDLDGVICRPPFGINPGRGKSKRRAGEGSKNLLWRTERWRYLGRQPMDGARAGLAALAQDYDCQVVSARSMEAAEFTTRWFRANIGLELPLNLRPDWREKPAQFKVRRIRELGAVAHFEDDAHTAQWVAEFLPAVFLVDWWRNRWLEGPNIHRIRTISEAVPMLESIALNPP